jgi:hypothetical protein
MVQLDRELNWCLAKKNLPKELDQMTSKLLSIGTG